MDPSSSTYVGGVEIQLYIPKDNTILVIEPIRIDKVKLMIEYCVVINDGLDRLLISKQFSFNVRISLK